MESDIKAPIDKNIALITLCVFIEVYTDSYPFYELHFREKY